jgi:hypothetical protein
MFLFLILMCMIPSKGADSSNWFSLLKSKSSDMCRICYSPYVTLQQSWRKTKDALDGEVNDS